MPGSMDLILNIFTTCFYICLCAYVYTFIDAGINTLHRADICSSENFTEVSIMHKQSLNK